MSSSTIGNGFQGKDITSEAVLVAGGAGYIGSHICKALAAIGCRPIVLDDLSAGHEWAVKWGPLVRAKIEDREAIRRLIAEYRPCGVIHLAAKTYVGESVKRPEIFFDNNVRQLTVLLEELHRGGIPAIVFSSSCAVYRTPAAIPVTEAEGFGPVSPYAQTKLFGEWAIDAYRVAHGMRYARLRYFNAAGADLEQEIGEDHDPETHLIPNALFAALKGHTLDVYGTDYNTPDGTCIRDYVHVNDLAQAHVLALRHILAGNDIIANLGSETGNSVLEVIKCVERVTGRHVPVAFKPRREGDAEALLASCAHAKAVLGWEPKYPGIDVIVESAYRWMRAHFPGA